MSIFSYFARKEKERRDAESEARSKRWAWEHEEGQRTEARVLDEMRKAFEPLSDEERREITLRVAMDDKQRGNSSGTWTENASRYSDCAHIANNLVRMREALTRP